LAIQQPGEAVLIKRFVAAGELATDDGGAQLPLSEMIGGVHFGIVQKGQQMVLLLKQPLSNLFRLPSLEGVWRSRLSQQLSKAGFQAIALRCCGAASPSGASRLSTSALCNRVRSSSQRNDHRTQTLKTRTIAL